jgi:hypothetical protein
MENCRGQTGTGTVMGVVGTTKTTNDLEWRSRNQHCRARKHETDGQWNEFNSGKMIGGKIIRKSGPTRTGMGPFAQGCARARKLLAWGRFIGETVGDMPKKPHPKKSGKSALLGVGLDGKDGHVRVTTGPNFKLVGGSAETHGVMQEKAIKVNEHLKKRGKTLETVSRDEFHEIADKVGLPLIDPPTHRNS